MSLRRERTSPTKGKMQPATKEKDITPQRKSQLNTSSSRYRDAAGVMMLTAQSQRSLKHY